MSEDLARGPATPQHASPEALTPTSAAEREPILDVLRGFALLGILLINIEFMRGADFYRAFSEAGSTDAATGVDRAVHFATGWLAAGKFLSSFAIMFGIGAGIIAMRALETGRSPRRVLARRYALLIPLGLAHMVLLFPGDILFLYGVAGMVLLAFVGLRAKAALWWAGGALAVLLVLSAGLVGLSAIAPEPPSDDPFTVGMEEFFDARAEQAVTAHQDGSYGDVVAANAWLALFTQVFSLVIIPWVVALFLIGFAVARAGWIRDLAAHRGRLRTAMVAGLGLGLPLNLATGRLGPMSQGAVMSGGDVDGVVIWSTAGQIIGAPILAIGYLSALALLCLRIGPIRPLAAVGRMSLSAYLLQSVLALAVFSGFGLFDRLSPAQGMLVVLGIWTVLLVVCPLWLRSFRFGPVEWLWRIWTYGRRQPIRNA
ncbi:MAG: DUF418 domain-containing protein [Euzebyales bacterium]|nr:DUF418 domain-containing protein [Euzebyales bacterium]